MLSRLSANRIRSIRNRRRNVVLGSELLESRCLLAALDDAFTTNDGDVLAVAATGVLANDDLTAAPAPTLQVDIGRNTGGDAPLQSGWSGFNHDGTSSHSVNYPSDTLAGVGNSVGVTVSGNTHYRDYAAITGGAFVGQSNLLSDSVLRNADGRMTLTLANLLDGEYELTTYHHGTQFGDGVFDMFFNDGNNTDTGNPTPIASFTGTAGSSPAGIASQTFRVQVVGGSTVQVHMDGGIAANHIQLNGFEITPLPSKTVTEMNGSVSAVGTATALNSGATVTLNSDGSFSYDPTTSASWQSLPTGQTAQETFTYAAIDDLGGTGTATVTITVVGAPGVGFDSYVVSSVATLNEPGPGVLTNDDLPIGAPDLLVDIGRNTGGDAPLQAGWSGFNHDGTSSHSVSYPSDRLAGNGNSVGFTVSGNTHYRDYAAITGGPFVGQSNLLSDSVLRNAGGRMTVTLANLVDGTYEVTTYHHGSQFGSGAFDMFFNDANNTDTGNPTPIATFVGSGGTTPSTVASQTFQVEVAGGSTVQVHMDGGAGGNHIQINGLELTLLSDRISVAEVNGNAASVDNQITLPSDATLTLNADGSFAYDPTTSAVFSALGANQVATDTFTYTIENDIAETDTGTVTIAVVGPNNLPIATANSYSTDEDNSTSGNVLTDDTGSGVDNDPDGSPLTVIAVEGSALNVGAPTSLSSGGSVIVDPNGALSYDPTNAAALRALGVGQQTTESFTYTISDGFFGTDTATVTVSIDGVNDAPVAADDDYVFDNSGNLSGNIITDDTGNGTDIDVDANDTISVISVDGAAGNVDSSITLGSGATLTVNSDGSLTYDLSTSPSLLALAAGQSSTETVSYTIADNSGVTSAATAAFTVQGENTGANPDTYSMDNLSTLTIPAAGILANDSFISPFLLDFGQDTGGDAPLQSGYFGFNRTGNGSAAHSQTYSHVLGAAGSIQVAVTNPTHYRDYAAITGGNFAGQSDLLSDSVLRNANGRMTITVSDLADGTYQLTTYHHGTQFGAGTFDLHMNDAGNTDVNNPTLVATGVVSSSGSTPASVMTQTFNVTVSGGNDVAFHLTGGTGPNHTQVNGFDLSVASPLNVVAVQNSNANVGNLVSTAMGATVTVNADGSFVYDPAGSQALQDLADGQSARDWFTYTSAQDANSGSAVVNIDVTGTPGAHNDFHSTDEDSPINTSAPGILGNDSLLPAGFDLSVDFSQTNENPLQAGWVGFAYNDALTHQEIYPSDALAGTGNSVTLTVANPTHYRDRSGISGGPFQPLDSMLSDHVLRNAAGTITMTFDDLLDGYYEFTVYAHDTEFGLGGSANRAPSPFDVRLTDGSSTNQTLFSGVITTGGNTPADVTTLTFPVFVSGGSPVAIDFDRPGSDNGHMSIAGVGIKTPFVPAITQIDGVANVGAPINTAAGADLQVEADGSFAYDPTVSATLQALPIGSSGTDGFTYTISDGGGTTETATVSISVTGVNDQPVTNPHAETTNEDAGTYTLDLLTLASDVDTGTVLVIDQVIQDVNASGRDLNGAFTLAGSQLSFDLNLYNDLAVNESEPLVFTYTVNDQDGQANSTATGTVTLTIEGRNDAPLPDAGGPYVVDEGTPIALDATATTDVDLSDVLTYRWDLNGDGNYDENITGVSPTVTLAQLTAIGLDDGLDPAQVFNVTVEVNDNSTIVTAGTTLTISNVAPSVILSGPAESVPNYVNDYVINITDPSPADTSAGFAVVVNWGDGVIDTYAAGEPTPINTTHAFPALGTYTVSITATDKDGAVGTTTLAVTIVPVALVDNVLRVGGTDDRNDRIIVHRASTDSIFVRYNDVRYGAFSEGDFMHVEVYGGDGDDWISFTNLRVNTVVYGEEGHDNLAGGTGNDTFFGGPGRDILLGGEGDNVIDGGDDNDTIATRSGNDTLSGGSGNDQLISAAGNDTLSGDDGNDRLSAGLGNDLVMGGIGNDILLGGEGQDVLIGNAGNDRMNGARGDDLLVGGDGNDHLFGDRGEDSIITGQAANEDDVNALGQVLLNWSISRLRSGLGTLTDDGTRDGLSGGGGADELLIGAEDNAVDVRANDTTILL